MGKEKIKFCTLNSNYRNNENKMLSIIILSSDGYSDCWNPLFALFKNNFPDINDYELILSTNEKNYAHPGLDIITLKNGINSAWSQRLEMSLKKAKNDIVMVMVEDFFLLSKMDGGYFKKYLDLIYQDKGIDHIRLLYNQEKIDPIKTDNILLDRIPSYSNHRFLFLPGLWKKKILQRYIVDFETPHIAEKMGNYRSFILKDNFYCVSKHFIENNEKLYDCATSGVVIKGKWGKWLPQRLEENEMEIDFSKRGFKTGESQKSAKIKVQMDMLKNIGSTTRSISATLKLFFK